MPRRIAIDIDSTLHHYWDQLEEVVLRRFGVELPYSGQSSWDITTLESEQLREAIVETHSEAYVRAAEPYPGAVETLRAWRDAGHFIHITSHRDAAAHDHTERWLREHGFAFDELYCSWDKLARCVELGIDVLVDDSPVNLLGAHERGIVGATIRHPWNAELCGRDGFVCADDWPALRRALQPVLDG